jgi:hypothetical protein
MGLLYLCEMLPGNVFGRSIKGDLVELFWATCV